jgi:hypothetical protein
MEKSEGYVDDVYYGVWDAAGTEVKGVTKLTSDTPGSEDAHYYPSITAISGSRALVSWTRGGDYSDVYYAVIDSSGSVVKAATNLTGDGTSSYDYKPDAAPVSGGSTVVAWSGGSYPYDTRYAVLDNAYNVATGPTTLSNPAATGGNFYVSVAPADGQAIVTWLDYDWSYRPNLYYALVAADGSQVTPPQIFLASRDSDPYIQTSFYGYGNTSYSWVPPGGVDGVAELVGAPYLAAAGDEAEAHVRFGNHGQELATGVELEATLGGGLVYVDDTLGIAPTVSDSTVVWQLPDLALLDVGDFTLSLRVPEGAAPGTSYGITLTLSSDGPESDPADNTASGDVVAAYGVFVPMVTGDYTPAGADAYEPDDSPGQASPIATDGTPQRHTFHVADDEDWVYFSVVDGQQYTIETSSLGSSCDTVMQLYAADGTTVLASDDDGGSGLASRIVWTAGETSTYYVRVYHYSGYGGHNTQYDLSVELM